MKNVKKNREKPTSIQLISAPKYGYPRWKKSLWLLEPQSCVASFAYRLRLSTTCQNRSFYNIKISPTWTIFAVFSHLYTSVRLMVFGKWNEGPEALWFKPVGFRLHKKNATENTVTISFAAWQNTLLCIPSLTLHSTTQLRLYNQLHA